MKTLYLHIGQPKTATTSIQSFLNKNKKVLAEQDYCYETFDFQYPKVGPNRNAFFLIGYCPDEFGNMQESLSLERKNKAFSTILKWFEKYNNVILTDEGLGALNNCDKKRIFSEVKQFCDDSKIQLKILIYIRRQDDFVYSLWKQKIRAGTKLRKWDDYIASGEYEQDYVYYDTTLELIEDIIGKENTLVRIFDHNNFKEKNSIYVDFLAAIGVKWTDKFSLIEKDANISFNDNYTYIRRVLIDSNVHRIAELNRITNRMMRDCLSLADKPKYDYFTPEERINFMKKFEKGNQKVKEKYFPDREYLFSPEADRGLPKWHVENSEMLDDIIRFFGIAFMHQEYEIEMLKQAHQQMQLEIEQLKQKS